MVDYCFKTKNKISDKDVAEKGFLLNKITNFGPKKLPANMHGRLFRYGRLLFLRKI